MIMHSLRRPRRSETSPQSSSFSILIAGLTAISPLDRASNLLYRVEKCGPVELRAKQEVVRRDIVRPDLVRKAVLKVPRSWIVILKELTEEKEAGGPLRESSSTVLQAVRTHLAEFLRDTPVYGPDHSHAYAARNLPVQEATPPMVDEAGRITDILWQNSTRLSSALLEDHATKAKEIDSRFLNYHPTKSRRNLEAAFIGDSLESFRRFVAAHLLMYESAQELAHTELPSRQPSAGLGFGNQLQATSLMF